MNFASPDRWASRIPAISASNAGIYVLKAGAQWFVAPNWSLIAKFDGELASGAQTLAARARCDTPGSTDIDLN